MMLDPPVSNPLVRTRRAKALLGTLVDICVEADSAAAASRAVAAAFSEIAAIHRLMSFHEAGSDLSRLNRAAPGAAVRVDARTAEVLAAARAYSLESGGAFDAGAGALLVERGCLPGVPAPSCAEADAPTTAPTADACVVERGQSVLDLGGIAKGYAVDRAIAVLAACGVASALVNAGGDLRHFGDVPVDIHVRDPADPGRVAKVVTLRNMALASSATSGLDGAAGSGSALMDVRAAQPLQPRGGVTVVAPSCLLADALTKVVLITGDPCHPMLGAYGAQVVLFQSPTS